MVERVTERSDGVTAERVTERDSGGGTTVIETRGGGSGMGFMIGLILLVALAIGAFYLYQSSQNEAVKTDAISDAARSVEKTADKVGDAVDDVTKK
jgi:Flp pilus assembly protein TadG